MLAKISIILTIASLLILNLFSLKESKAQSRSKYMDKGDVYLSKVNSLLNGSEMMTAYALSALACYTAALAEK